jgi:hypothetical protein
LDKQGLLSIFKGGVLPPNLVVTDKGFEYTELIVDKATILSNSMLDGWHITGVTPRRGTNWRVEVTSGSAIVTVQFGELHNQSVTVTLTKDGTSETQDINIAFSVEKSGILGGCNIGATILALLAFSAFVIRRKR